MRVELKSGLGFRVRFRVRVRAGDRGRVLSRPPPLFAPSQAGALRGGVAPTGRDVELALAHGAPDLGPAGGASVLLVLER